MLPGCRCRRPSFRSLIVAFTVMTTVGAVKAMADTTTTTAMTASGSATDTGTGLTISQSTSGEYDGVISGSGGLTVQTSDTTKAPTITLGGANTYTGDTTVNQATLVLKAGSSLQSSNFSLSNGSIDASALSNFSVANLSGSGSLVGPASGTLTLGNFSGAQITSADNIDITGTVTDAGEMMATSGITVENGATLNVASGAAVPGPATITNDGTIVSAGTYFGGNIVNNKDASLSGSISSVAGSLTNAGDVNLTDVGYIGGAVSNTGTMSLGFTSSGSNLSGGVMNNAGDMTLTASGDSSVATTSQEIDSIISSYPLASGNSVVKSLGNAAGANLTIDGIIGITGSDNTAASATLDGNVTIDDGSALITNSNSNESITGTVTEKGTGILVGNYTITSTGLVNGNAYTENGITLDGGKITGTLNANNLSVTANGGTVGSLTSTGGNTLAGTLTVENAKGTITGNMTGSGTLDIKAGTENFNSADVEVNVNVEAPATITGSLSGYGNLTLDGTYNTTAGNVLGSLQGSGNISLGSAAYIYFGSYGSNTPTDNTVFSGVISDADGVDNSGNNGIIFDNGKTMTLTGQNTYKGKTLIASGTLVLDGGSLFGNVGTAGGVFKVVGSDTSIGSLYGGTGVVLDKSLTINASRATQASDYAMAGVISGDGGVTIANGTEAFSAQNTYTGATTIDSGATLDLTGTSSTLSDNGGISQSSSAIVDGTLDASALEAGFDLQSLAGSGSVALGSNSLKIDNAADEFSGVVSGTGGVEIAGGHETFSGANTYTGDTTVEDGILNVDGSIDASNITVQANGELGGTGSVSNTVAQAGSIIDATQGLSFSQNLSIDGGTLMAKQGSIVSVAGDVSLSGNSALDYNVSALKLGQTLTVLQGGGSVSGKFASVDLNSGAANYAYVSPTVQYDADQIAISFARNGTSFGGGTRNQNAVGTSMDATSGGAILSAFEGMSTEQARRAEDMMSGEMLSSERTAMIQNTDIIRTAVFDRLASANCYFDSAMAIYDIKSGKRIMRGCHAKGAVLWGQAFGSLGSNGAEGGAHTLSHSNAGFIMGVDQAFGAWRSGVMISYGRSNMNTSALASSAHSNDVSVGIYGGRSWNNLSLRLGASYTWNMISSRRTIASSGMDFGRANADHLGGTAQAFAEVAYHFDVSGVNVEPFANVAYVNQQMTGYHETGSLAALHVRGSDMGTTFASVGSRFSKSFRLENGADLTPYASLGYRHAFGNMTPGMHAYYAGGIDMDIAGTPLTQDAVTTELGVSYKLSDRITLKLGYHGQYGQHYNDNGITGNFSMKF